MPIVRCSIELLLPISLAVKGVLNYFTANFMPDEYGVSLYILLHVTFYLLCEQTPLEIIFLFPSLS